MSFSLIYPDKRQHYILFSTFKKCTEINMHHEMVSKYGFNTAGSCCIKVSSLDSLNNNAIPHDMVQLPFLRFSYWHASGNRKRFLLFSMSTTWPFPIYSHGARWIICYITTECSNAILKWNSHFCILYFMKLFAAWTFHYFHFQSQSVKSSGTENGFFYNRNMQKKSPICENFIQ